MILYYWATVALTNLVLYWAAITMQDTLLAFMSGMMFTYAVYEYLKAAE